MKDKIVFDKLEASNRGWLFEAHLELNNTDSRGVETDAFNKAFSQPVELPILAGHDVGRPIGNISGDGSGKFTGVIDAYVQCRMALGIGFSHLKSRVENGKRILEEVKLFEVSIFPIEAGPQI